jgi:protein-tyrosine phosphatase
VNPGVPEADVRKEIVMRAVPIPDSYWLKEGVLLAGEYPGAYDPGRARQKLAKFLDAGIRTFIDLTETSEELTKYDDILRDLAAERGIEVRHLRFSIPDRGVPQDRALMSRILAAVRSEIEAGRPVYIHCWGGIGRTGTVIGCWLVEEGLAGAAAIEKIAELRKGIPDGFWPSPENAAQRRFIEEHRKG